MKTQCTRFTLQDQGIDNVLAKMDYENYLDENEIQIEEMNLIERKELRNKFLL